MKDCGIVRTKLDRPHITTLSERHRDDEVAIDVRTVGRDGVRLRHFDHEVRLAQLPAGRPIGKWRQIGRIALGRAGSHPLLNQSNLLIGQPPLALQIAEACIGKPGGHQSLLGDLRNLLGTFLDVMVVQ